MQVGFVMEMRVIPVSGRMVEHGEARVPRLPRHDEDMRSAIIHRRDMQSVPVQRRRIRQTVCHPQAHLLSFVQQQGRTENIPIGSHGRGDRARTKLHRPLPQHKLHFAPRQRVGDEQGILRRERRGQENNHQRNNHQRNYHISHSWIPDSKKKSCKENDADEVIDGFRRMNAKASREGRLFYACGRR
jgi:hypothetical protein